MDQYDIRPVQGKKMTHLHFSTRLLCSLAKYHTPHLCNKQHIAKIKTSFEGVWSIEYCLLLNSLFVQLLHTQIVLKLLKY